MARLILVLCWLASAGPALAAAPAGPAGQDPRFRPGLVLGAVLFALMALTTAYALRLSRRLGRLGKHLETELAERKRAEGALRESEAFYHSLVEGLPQNILRKDLDGRFTFANSRACATLGRPLEEIVGRTDADFFPPDLAEKYRHDDAAVLSSGASFETIEGHVTPDGERHDMLVIKGPLRDPAGAVIGVQVIFWDVTATKRAERELAASEERFALAVRGSKAGIWDWDVATGVMYCSPRLRELFGLEDGEITEAMGRFEARLHPDDRARVMKALNDHLAARTPYDVEYRFRAGPGEYVWVQARGQALWDEAGRPTRMAGSISDISRRKQIEEQLRAQNLRLQEMALSERQAHEALKLAQCRMVETAKLAGLGQMVAGVAHEINNPLAFVVNNLAVLQRDLESILAYVSLYAEADPLLADARPELAARLAEYRDHVDMDYTLANLANLLQRTRGGLDRIQQIVKGLRTFARLDEGDLGVADLNDGIATTVDIILGHARKKDVRVELDLRPLPAVSCYPAKINQVVMNLVVNAIDACAEGGVVVLRSRVDGGGDAVLIEVVDDGCGVAPAIRDKIFDPFFTTKPVGVGTGLGLSISYAIVQDHGGSIEVDPAPGGRGTRFAVRLPVQLESRPAPAAPAPPADGVPAGALALAPAGPESEESR